ARTRGRHGPELAALVRRLDGALHDRLRRLRLPAHHEKPQGGPALHIGRDAGGDAALPAGRRRVAPGLHLFDSDNVRLRRRRLVRRRLGDHHPGLPPRASRRRVERPARGQERFMSDRTSFYPELAKKIAPAEGRLAVLLPGLGAVSTTLIAGTHLIRKGLAKPF